MKICIGLLLLLPLIAAEPSGYKYWSAAQLKGMSHPLSNKADAHTSNEILANFGPTRAMMVHRDATGAAEQHENDADVMVVVSGTAELIFGGTMRDGKTTAAGEIRGPGIDGGTRQKLAAGDIAHIPPKTPHQVMLAPGKQITYFVFKAKE